MSARTALFAALSLAVFTGRGPAQSNTGEFTNAVTMMKRQQWDTARFILERLLRSSPNDPAVRNNLAVCLIKLGRSADAEAHLKAVLEGEPNRAGSLLNLGVALQGMGRPGDALKQTTEAVTQWAKQNEPGYWRAVAHFNRGWLIDENSGFDAAITQLREGGGNPFAPKLAKEQLEAAVRAYRESVKIRPTYARAWLGLAVSLGKLGRVEEAKEALGEAARYQSDDPEVPALIHPNRTALDSASEFRDLFDSIDRPPAPKTMSPPPATAPPPAAPPAQTGRTFLRDGLTGITGLWDWSKLWSCVLVVFINFGAAGGLGERFKVLDRTGYPDPKAWGGAAAVIGVVVVALAFGFVGWWKWLLLVVIPVMNVGAFDGVRQSP